MNKKTAPALTAKIIDTFELPADRVAHWESLTDQQRLDWYAQGNAQVRIDAATEAAYGKLGTRGHTGRGSSLATAVDLAWDAEIHRRRHGTPEPAPTYTLNWRLSDADYPQYQTQEFQTQSEAEAFLQTLGPEIPYEIHNAETGARTIGRTGWPAPAAPADPAGQDSPQEIDWSAPDFMISIHRPDGTQVHAVAGMTRRAALMEIANFRTQAGLPYSNIPDGYTIRCTPPLEESEAPEPTAAELLDTGFELYMG